MTTYAKQRTQIPALRHIGTWATWWWGISGLYLVELIWQSRNIYQLNTHGGFSPHALDIGNV